jgi:hypothetical protein
MRKTFKKPTRVWVNAPSTLQSAHQFHGRVGIALTDKYDQTMLYFTEGDIHALIVDSLYLETLNSHDNKFKYSNP